MQTRRDVIRSASATALAASLPAFTSLADARTGVAELDWSACLARLEMIVAELRERHVMDGWTIDNDAAERALGYLRRQVANSPSPEDDEDEGFTDFLAFMREHGQNLDFIFLDGDVVGMICRLASHSPRAAMIRAATGQDRELFRLVAQFDAVHAEWKRASARHEELDRQADASLSPRPPDLPENDIAVIEWREAQWRARIENGTVAAFQTQSALLTRVNRAYDRLIDCPAKTFAGMRAKVRAYQEWFGDGSGYGDEAETAVASIAADFDAMGAGNG